MDEQQLVTVGLAFLEGLALIISPCILPILPIVLSGSLTGSKARPVGIITGFILTFCVLTLFSRAILSILHVSPDALRNVSFVLLLILGVIMMSDYLSEKFNFSTQRLMGVGSSWSSANNPQSGFWGGLLFGTLVSVIWTPCAGPILAAVIVQVVLQQTSFASAITVLAFAIGAGLPMLFIALVGQRIMQHFRFLREHAVLLRRLLGLIIVLSVLFLLYNSSALFARFSAPPYAHDQLNSHALENGIEKPYAAPAIGGIDAWINSPPLTLNQLKGKVVLIDFWTYSCINCIRTLPYLKDWYAKYHDKGLVIIGIHSPEFQFEHNVENVKQAVKKFDIEYPVALDNEFVTWRHFYNEYWPAHYLIDQAGNVVYQHAGEGEYDVTENNIRYLLGIKEKTAAAHKEEAYSMHETPETYLGYNRAENFVNSFTIARNVPATYRYPDSIAADHWALQGNWTVYPDKIVANSAGAALKIHFSAGKVYAVMGAPEENVKVTLRLNGAPLTANAGDDVTQSVVDVGAHELYSLLRFNQEKNGELELIAGAPGLELYTFTFGN